MGNVYKVGDIFVSPKYGVVTILEVDNESDSPRYKCKVYSKIEVRDSIKYYDKIHFNVWIQYEDYKFYPVVE
jgi:hypothetical protein